jgi:uncharacterized protein (TIGR03435 family)
MKQAAFFFVAAVVFGQTPPAFEVASIKPAPPITPDTFRNGPPHLGVKLDKARADFGGMGLLSLIAYAYRVKSYQISGPDWMNTERFDIIANLPEGGTPEQAPEMLQALLADRFKLTLHRDSKEFPVYALIVGKNGAKLTPKPADYDRTVKSNVRPMTLEGYASLLSGAVDRPVVDLTELKGEYMLSMEVMMRGLMNRAKAQAERQAATMNGRGPSETASDPDSDAFATVQSLGLKLEPRKLPMPYLIVDRLEKTPTGN